MNNSLRMMFACCALTGSALAFSKTDNPNMANLALPWVAGGWPAQQQIEGVPDYHEMTPRLVNIPHATGRRVSLFNGKDLNHFTPYLGYAKGGMFPSTPDEQPLGETGIGEVFKPVKVDGKNAIYLSGKVWGSINTKRDLGNYHLQLWYKFGRRWMPDLPENSGVLYHSHGPYGVFAHTWMSSIEFEIMTGLTGSLDMVGSDISAQTELAKGPGPGLYGLKDNFYFMPGGKPTEVRMPTPVRQAKMVEHPTGEWNKIDLYVADDAAVQVVNDVPVMVLTKITETGPDGVRRPLTHGRIQLQSEGTEVYMRDIWFEPIRSVPKVVAN
jgi:Domain of Unknown Function (DUF1080)